MQLSRVHTVIIGGGVQGTALALKLKSAGDNNFVILDPQPLMAEWFRNTKNQRLQLLRTPHTANLDPSASATMLPARSKTDPSSPANVDLFNRFHTKLISNYNIELHRTAGQVKGIIPAGNDFIVEATVNKQSIHYLARNVVCAVGMGKPWMPDICVNTPNIVHSHYVNLVHGHFNYGYGSRFAIVGSGLTAATIANYFADNYINVNLFCRSEMSVSQLETVPEWRPGQRLHDTFLNTSKMVERVRQLKAARAMNVVTPDTWDKTTSHLNTGRIKIHSNGAVESVDIDTNGAVKIGDATFDHVIFATGYKIDAALMPMLKDVIDPNKDTANGLPILENDCSHHRFKNLFFMGKLAELTVGPLGRNIPGAIYASKKITERIMTDKEPVIPTGRRTREELQLSF